MQRIRHTMAPEQDTKVTLEEVHDALQFFMESIAGIPIVPLASTSTGYVPGEKDTRAVTILVPPEITISPTSREHNRLTYTAIGALHAAAYKYQTGFDPTDVAEIVRWAHNEGNKRFPKKNPIIECQYKEIRALETRYSEKPAVRHEREELTIPTENLKIKLTTLEQSTFSNHFRYQKLMEEIIEITEQGRTM